MHRRPSRLRHFRQLAALAVWVAVSAAGCSSADPGFALDQDLGGGAGYEGGDLPSDPDDDESPPPPDGDTGEPGDSEGGAGDELPPEPDDRGVDNGTETEACNDDAEVSVVLSPDDSNSAFSPVQVREAVLGDWGTVQSVAIRTWEFFNYYDFGYPAADAGTIAIHPALVHPPGAPDGEFVLQVGVSSETVSTASRPPVNLTLVLDTSGSMEGFAMDMLKLSAEAIASSLRQGDTISIVGWATEDAVLLGGHEVDGPDDATLLAEIAALSANGTSDLHGGLVAGYEQAQSHYDPDGINRVVLVSDGGANLGITDLDIIAEHAGDEGQDGIYLVGVGVGDAFSYHHQLMDLVTSAGKGASVLIATPDEAWSTFGDGFISTMGIAARDVHVQLDLPPGFEVLQPIAEDSVDDPSKVEPQHLAPNDAMVFHQRIATCAPELLAAATPFTITVRYLDATTFAPVEVEYTLPMAQLLEADAGPLLKGAAVFAYAEGLKAYKRAELDARATSLQHALDALERAEAVLPGDPELDEIRSVLETLAQ